MNCYFPLAAQFRTQEEPAFCGLTTLVMVLNALGKEEGGDEEGEDKIEEDKGDDDGHNEPSYITELYNLYGRFRR